MHYVKYDCVKNNRVFVAGRVMKCQNERHANNLLRNFNENYSGWKYSNVRLSSEKEWNMTENENERLDYSNKLLKLA